MDLTRVYGTGHSLGSRTVQTLTHNSEAYYFAAVASTSFNNTQFTADSMMPSYLLAGQADIDSLVAAPWLSGDNNSIHDWVTGAQKMNGLDVTFSPPTTTPASWPPAPAMTRAAATTPTPGRTATASPWSSSPAPWPGSTTATPRSSGWPGTSWSTTAWPRTAPAITAPPPLPTTTL